MNDNSNNFQPSSSFSDEDNDFFASLAESMEFDSLGSLEESQVRETLVVLSSGALTALRLLQRTAKGNEETSHHMAAKFLGLAYEYEPLFYNQIRKYSSDYNSQLQACRKMLEGRGNSTLWSSLQRVHDYYSDESNPVDLEEKAPHVLWYVTKYSNLIHRLLDY